MSDAAFANMEHLKGRRPSARPPALGDCMAALAVALLALSWLPAAVSPACAWAVEPPDRAGSALAAESAEVAGGDESAGAPAITTTLVDGADGDHGATADEAITLVDVISYSGVTPGAPYTVTGTLHVRAADGSDAGLARDGRGREITATEAFVPEADAGEANVTFAFAAPALAGKTVVAYEKLARDGRTCAVHADISDGDQTVWFAPAHVMSGEPTDGMPPATPPPKGSSPAAAPTVRTGMTGGGALPRTDDEVVVAPFAAAAVTALGAALAALRMRRLRREREIVISRGPARQRARPGG